MSAFAKEKVLGPEEEREGHLAHPASQFLPQLQLAI